MTHPASWARPTARVCGALALSIALLFLLVAVLPFYANGIHLHSYAEIFGSQVDIKGYPPFTWPAVGLPLLLLAHLAYIFVPFLALPALAVLALALLTGWRTFSAAERLRGVATLAATVIILAGGWPIWSHLGAWIAD